MTTLRIPVGPYRASHTVAESEVTNRRRLERRIPRPVVCLRGGWVTPPKEGRRKEIHVAQETKMSRAEAGRKGGLTTKRRYGDEFFGRIGRIGGKKGGDTTKRRYGV